MPPIKNWSRVDANGYVAAWEHAQTGEQVRIYHDPDAFERPYQAEVYGGSGYGVDSLHYFGGEESKNRLRKEVVSWMRDHPEGLKHD